MTSQMYSTGLLMMCDLKNVCLLSSDVVVLHCSGHDDAVQFVFVLCCADLLLDSLMFPGLNYSAFSCRLKSHDSVTRSEAQKNVCQRSGET